jgi:hypothetical protein
LSSGLLDRRDVIDAFGEGSRQLLEPRIAIEFQRVEVAVLFLQQLELRLDLRLGLDFDLAHLGAQANYAGGELQEIGLQRTQLAFDPAPARWRLRRLR